MTEFQCRFARPRTYLKGMGLLTNSQRGVWSVTELGETVAVDQIPTLRAEYIASTRKKRPKKKAQVAGWTVRLIKRKPRRRLLEGRSSRHVTQYVAAAFERLAQRLLREAGYPAPLLPDGQVMAALMVGGSTRSRY